MKKLLQQFFYVPKHDAVPERVFLARTTLSLVSILACLVMLCATTLAWFYDTGASAVESIQAAQFGVSVKQGDTAVPIDATTGVSTFTCPGAVDSAYTFTLTATGSATQGYCVIHVTDGSTVVAAKTVAFPHEGSMTLNVTVQQGATITFTPCWGEPTAGEGGIQTAALTTATGERLYGDGDTIYVSESDFVPPPTNDLPSVPEPDTDSDTDTDSAPAPDPAPDTDTDTDTDTPSEPDMGTDTGTDTNTSTDTDTSTPANPAPHPPPKVRRRPPAPTPTAPTAPTPAAPTQTLRRTQTLRPTQMLRRTSRDEPHHEYEQNRPNVLFGRFLCPLSRLRRQLSQRESQGGAPPINGA